MEIALGHWLEDQDTSYKHKYLPFFLIWALCLVRNEAIFKENLSIPSRVFYKVQNAFNAYEQPSR